MKDFKKLEVWKKSMKLVINTYKKSSSLPEEEKFGLTAQMRRAAVSIPSNIAEGAGRSTDKEKWRFMEYAIASSFELETQFILCAELDLISRNDVEIILSELSELQRQMYRFQQVLGK